jgi:hypothetical protein
MLSHHLFDLEIRRPFLRDMVPHVLVVPNVPVEDGFVLDTTAFTPNGTVNPAALIGEHMAGRQAQIQ